MIPISENHASWFGRSTTLESKVLVVLHVAYLLLTGQLELCATSAKRAQRLTG
jgi:hypothetical protein